MSAIEALSRKKCDGAHAEIYRAALCGGIVGASAGNPAAGVNGGRLGVAGGCRFGIVSAAWLSCRLESERAAGAVAGAVAEIVASVRARRKPLR